MAFKIKRRIPPVIVFFILLYPKCLDYIPQAFWLIKIIYILQIIISLFFFSKMFFFKSLRSNRELCIFIGLFTIFNLSYIISDLHVGVLAQTLTINLRRYLVMCGLAIYLEKQKVNNKYQILKALYHYLSIFMIVNLACDILFPNGIAKMTMYTDEGYITWSDSVGFLDADNRVSLFGLLYIYIANIYCYLKKGKHQIKIGAYFLTCLNILFAKSGSGIIVLIFVLVYQMFVRRKDIIQSMLTWKSITLFAVFIGLFVSGKFSWLLILLGNMFDKGATLSGRTTIWMEAIDKIIKSPIWGYGTLDGGAFFKIGSYTWYSHNQYLQRCTKGT